MVRVASWLPRALALGLLTFAAPLGGRVTQASTWQRVRPDAPKPAPSGGGAACTLRGSVFEGLC